MRLTRRGALGALGAAAVSPAVAQEPSVRFDPKKLRWFVHGPTVGASLETVQAHQGLIGEPTVLVTQGNEHVILGRHILRDMLATLEQETQRKK